MKSKKQIENKLIQLKKGLKASQSPRKHSKIIALEWVIGNIKTI